MRAASDRGYTVVASLVHVYILKTSTELRT